MDWYVMARVRPDLEDATVRPGGFEKPLFCLLSALSQK